MLEWTHAPWWVADVDAVIEDDPVGVVDNADGIILDLPSFVGLSAHQP